MTRGGDLRIENSRKPKYESWVWALEETGKQGALNTSWIVSQGNESTSSPQLEVENRKLA